MIIRISLLLVVGSVIFLLLADCSAWLGFQSLMVFFTQLGAAILLCAFVLLIAKGLLAIAKTTILSIADFFSSPKRIQRRVLFIHAKRDQLNRLFYFKTLQLNYFRQQKIKHLLNKNNRQHLVSLSRAIQKDLHALKKNIPALTFEELKQENRSHRNRQDIDALLQLQQKISTLA